jgi:hypothetical protein
MTSISWNVSFVAWAVSIAAAAQERPRRTPPAEAYTACTAKAQGDACSVQMPDRAVAGVCAADPQQKLFCAPQGHGPGGPHSPPPEAVAACSAKQDGESCSVTLPDGALRSGVCRAGPGSVIACAPAGGPPPQPRP